MTEIIRTLPFRECLRCNGRGEIYQMQYHHVVISDFVRGIGTIWDDKVEIVMCPFCKGKRKVPA